MKKYNMFFKKFNLYFSCTDGKQIIVATNRHAPSMNMIDIEGERFFYSKTINTIEGTNLAIYEWTYLEVRLIRTAVK